MGFIYNKKIIEYHQLSFDYHLIVLSIVCTSVGVMAAFVFFQNLDISIQGNTLQFKGWYLHWFSYININGANIARRCKSNVYTRPQKKK